MVNTEDFIKRLEIIFDYYSVSASGFADSIGVQRSALSHLMSGRNKPSLDLIMKIVESYPEVDMYWLLNGKGNFPKENVPEIKPGPPTLSKSQATDLFSSNDNPEENAVANNAMEEQSHKIDKSQSSSTDIEYIAVFYKDGTFKKYRPQ